MPLHSNFTASAYAGTLSPHDATPTYNDDVTPMYGIAPTMVQPDCRHGHGLGVGAVRVMECDEHHLMHGSSTVVCNRDGRWSPVPTCKATTTTSDFIYLYVHVDLRELIRNFLA